MFMNMMAWSYS